MTIAKTWTRINVSLPLVKKGEKKHTGSYPLFFYLTAAEDPYAEFAEIGNEMRRLAEKNGFAANLKDVPGDMAVDPAGRAQYGQKEVPAEEVDASYHDYDLVIGNMRLHLVDVIPQ